MNLPMRPFLLASVVGRAARFMAVGLLIYLFGESVREFIDANFELLTVAAGAGMLALAAAWVVYNRTRGRRVAE